MPIAEVALVCIFLLAVVLWRRNLALAGRLRLLTGQNLWYRKAVDCAGVGVWQWNMRTEDWHWIDRPSWSGPNGSLFEAPDGQAFFDRIHPEDCKLQLAREQECINGKGSLRSEYRYVLPSGEVRWLRDVGDVERDERGIATNMLGLTLDVTAEKESELRLERSSQHDDLTGLPNRRALKAYLEARLQKPEEWPFVVAFIDLNGFKAINDRYGHAAGDDCLMRIGAAFTAVCGESEFCARVGGDEFVIVVKGVEVEWAVARARTLLNHVFNQVRAGVPSSLLGAAVGIACSVRDGSTPEELLSRADEAMYRAKASGDDVAFAAATAGGGQLEPRSKVA